MVKEIMVKYRLKDFEFLDDIENKFIEIKGNIFPTIISVDYKHYKKLNVIFFDNFRRPFNDEFPTIFGILPVKLEENEK